LKSVRANRWQFQHFEADMNRKETWIPWAVIIAAVMASVLLVNPAQSSTMKINITINGKAMTATLIDSATARDFVSLLPLTLTMNDLFSREKFAHLPRALAEGGERVRTYEVGDVIYWSPGPDVALFYRHDGQAVPSPGIIVLGKIEGGVEALRVSGPMTVTMETIKN
jgi:hypothetical protein